MLPEDHPRRAEFQELTKTAEAIGLFEDSTRIGFREQWLRLVREKGYQIVGHELIPIANDETAIAPDEDTINGSSVARHLTALVRHAFSAPVQALARYGLISPSVIAGMHPALVMLGGIQIPYAKNQLEAAGGLLGESIEVIDMPKTGLRSQPFGDRL